MKAAWFRLLREIWTPTIRGNYAGSTGIIPPVGRFNGAICVVPLFNHPTTNIESRTLEAFVVGHSPVLQYITSDKAEIASVNELRPSMTVVHPALIQFAYLW